MMMDHMVQEDTFPPCKTLYVMHTSSQWIGLKLNEHTSIDHDAHHSLRVADGAAPQQEVAVVEANTNPIGMLPVERHHQQSLNNTGLIPDIYLMAFST